MTFDPTINAGNLVVVALALLGLIGGWYKFGGRLDMLEYRVRAMEEALKLIASAIEKQNSMEKLLALVDQRVLIVEGLVHTVQRDLSDLRKGDGWIKPNNRKGINGEYE
jgi:hypothetical protein